MGSSPLVESVPPPPPPPPLTPFASSLFLGMYTSLTSYSKHLLLELLLLLMCLPHSTVYTPFLLFLTLYSRPFFTHPLMHSVTLTCAPSLYSKHPLSRLPHSTMYTSHTHTVTLTCVSPSLYLISPPLTQQCIPPSHNYLTQWGL